MSKLPEAVGNNIIGGNSTLVWLFGVKYKGIKQKEKFPEWQIGCIGEGGGGGAWLVGLCCPFQEVSESAVAFKDG